MKNKILLLTVLMLAFALSFVLVINAENPTIPDWTDIITYENVIEYKDGFDTTSRVLLSNGDGTYSTYPSNYIIKGNDDVFSVSNELDFTALKAASGKNYSYASVIRFEMPVGYKSVEARAFKNDKGFTALQTVKVCHGVTTMGINIFYDSKTVMEVELPSTLEAIGTEFAYCATGLRTINIPEGLIEIPKQAFRGCTNLKTVDFSKANSLKTIGYWSFYQCNSLEEAILPEGLTFIDELAFKKSGVKTVYLPSTLETIKTEAFSTCTSLENIECKSTILGENMFKDCCALKSVDLSSVVTISQRAFYITANQNPSQLESVVFSNKLTTIGEYAFIRSAIKSIEIPSSVTEIGIGVFSTNLKLEKVVYYGSIMGASMFVDCSRLSELVITTDFVTYGSGALNNVSTTFTTYYTGSDYARIKSLCVVSRITQAKYYSYEDYKAGKYEQANYMFIYDANLCEAAYGEHTISAPVYHFVSFTDETRVSIGCSRCGVGSTLETIAPIFTCLGYSVAEAGEGGIVLGYTVNHQSIEKYEEYNKKDFTFGVFVALYEKIGERDIFGENGKMIDGAIGADLSNHQYDVFILKVVGFTEEQKNAVLIIGAYIKIADEDKTEYFYLQNDKPKENEKYYYASYNDMMISNNDA